MLTLTHQLKSRFLSTMYHFVYSLQIPQMSMKVQNRVGTQSIPDQAAIQYLDWVTVLAMPFLCI